jgi:hypothetical protein
MAADDFRDILRQELAPIRVEIETVRAEMEAIKGHVWTAPAMPDSQRNVRAQSCIRPVNAAVLTAGPDVIR